jgi:hypothetical protein
MRFCYLGSRKVESKCKVLFNSIVQWIQSQLCSPSYPSKQVYSPQLFPEYPLLL